MFSNDSSRQSCSKHVPAILLTMLLTATNGSSLKGAVRGWHQMRPGSVIFQSQNGMMTLSYSRPLLLCMLSNCMPSASSVCMVRSQ